VSNAQRLKGTYHIENGQLLFEWGEYIVHISSSSEIFIIHEIFVDTCYRFRLPKQQTVAVIDIGMNVGLASLYFAGLHYVQKVISFEPFKPTFDLAEQNMGLNPTLATKIERHNFGLGEKNEVVEVPYNATNSGVSSTQSDNPRNAQATQTEQLQIKAAHEAIAKVLSENPDMHFMIKMDTEGAEYAIFESLFSQPLDKRITGIMMEWHFKGSEQLEEQLIGQGFRLFSLGLGVKAGLIYGYR
jgi:FkbM family methyltransferase